VTAFRHVAERPIKRPEIRARISRSCAAAPASSVRFGSYGTQLTGLERK